MVCNKPGKIFSETDLFKSTLFSTFNYLSCYTNYIIAHIIYEKLCLVTNQIGVYCQI